MTYNVESYTRRIVFLTNLTGIQNFISVLGTKDFNSYKLPVIFQYFAMDTMLQRINHYYHMNMRLLEKLRNESYANLFCS